MSTPAAARSRIGGCPAIAGPGRSCRLRTSARGRAPRRPGRPAPTPSARSRPPSGSRGSGCSRRSRRRGRRRSRAECSLPCGVIAGMIPPMSIRTLIAPILMLVAAAAPAAAQGWNTPTDAQRCPSKWGASDTRGSANHVKPASVLAAMQLVKTGQIIELGRVLEGTMPVFGTRRFDLHTKRTVINTGRNRRGSNEEIVISEIGQVGTQFDAFPHQMIGNSFYNCVPIAGNETRTGFGKLGVEQRRLADRARRADRRGGAEGRAGAARHLRDHAAGPGAGAGAAEADAEAGRRDPDPHRLGHAVERRQRALREDVPGHRRRRGGVAGEAGSAARRRRQLAGRSRPEPRSRSVAAGAPDHAGGQRHPHPGEHEARRARRGARARVRVRACSR